jgi:diguanylate cyclase (GGDEF)-like protein/PAS domain S-box-containing protein
MPTMAEDKPRLSQDRLADIAGRMAQLGGWIVELPSGAVHWSDQVCDIHELPRGSSPTIEEALDFYAPEPRLQLRLAAEACTEHGIPFDLELPITSARGRALWVHVIGEAVRDANGTIVLMQGAFQDITLARLAEEQRSRLDARLTSTLESISEAFVMVNRDFSFGYLNRVAEQLMQCTREEVIGKNIWECFPDTVGTRYHEQYTRAMRDRRSTSFEEYYPRLKIWTDIRAYYTDEGLAVYFVDITERKNAEAEIRSLAYYDVLTGLPNRQLLMLRMQQAIEACRADGLYRSALTIDLDNFKSINDTRGHETGDVLLKSVVQRLARTIKPGEFIARFGGDEFVVLLNDAHASENEAARHAQACAQAIVDVFTRAFDVAGLPQHSTASIGVAIIGGAPLTPDEVLKRTDLAMYQAKAAGRNTAVLFNPAMQARLSQRVMLETDLRHAVERDELLLHYQPLADVAGRMTGVEALVRWRHGVHGLVPPNDFIPVAEDTGLIIGIGNWVLRTACRQLAVWGRSRSTDSLTMAVNVSAHQFHRADFVDHVLAAIRETGADPRRLKLELTESLLVKDVDATIGRMRELRHAGVGFSLDDFGTGYSSLSLLHRLPLDQLKIDQSFVRGALHEQHGAVIARTILALGKALDLAVLAEGVETREQLDFVIAAGCHAWQGFLFSRPLPAAQLAQFVARTGSAAVL